MSREHGRRIKSRNEKCPRLRVVLICVLMTMLSGCNLVVMQADYNEDKEKNQKEVSAVRSQLLAHTQILANHGKSLNEFKLQIRHAVSTVEKTVKELSGRPTSRTDYAKPNRKKESARKPASQNEITMATRYIRRTYRGLLLSYAGGYNEPGSSRYPYKLKPGTLVAVISSDRRGFTRVQVKSGRWEGKKMWVRTRWLTEQAPKRMGSKG